MKVNFLKGLFTLRGVSFAATIGSFLVSQSALAVEGVHRHGQGNLQILQVENQWQLTLSLPLDDAFGFEHAPETEQQKAKIRHFVSLATSFDAFFEVRGICSLQDVTVNLPGPFHEDTSPSHKHDEHDQEAHDDVHERQHEDVHGHKDVETIYQINCEEAIKSISVNLPSISPSLVSIDAQWATENGQGMQVITAKGNTLFLQR